MGDVAGCGGGGGGGGEEMAIAEVVHGLGMSCEWNRGGSAGEVGDGSGCWS